MINKNLCFALTNQGLMNDVESEVREKNPTWSDTKIKNSRNELLKKATLYNAKNKKAKKAKR